MNAGNLRYHFRTAEFWNFKTWQKIKLLFYVGLLITVSQNHPRQISLRSWTQKELKFQLKMDKTMMPTIPTRKLKCVANTDQESIKLLVSVVHLWHGM